MNTNMKLKIERYTQKLYDNGYTLLSNFDNTKDNFLVECKMGHEFYTNCEEMRHRKFKCKICNKIESAVNRKNKIYEIFIKRNLKLLDDLDLLENLNADTYLNFECENGHQHRMRLKHIQDGHGCKICGHEINIEKKKIQTDVIKYNVELNQDFTFINKWYNNHRLQIKIKCQNDHVFDIGYFNFLNRRKCPFCGLSEGAKKIQNWLDKNHLDYKMEYKFDDLKSDYGNCLRFDFAVFINDEILSLIEYDGQYHFIKFYDDQSFDLLQLHDNRKNEYCKNRLISLLRIPYWKFSNIDEILSKTLLTNELGEQIG